MATPPAGFRYIYAHTHLHPERLSRAIGRWFAEHSNWTLEYPGEPELVARFLLERGVERFVFFSYAHKAGIARELNAWLHATAQKLPDGQALGTVHPDDPDMLFVADEALDTYPYPYEDEREALWQRDLPMSVYEKIFHDNAARIFGL